MIPDSVDNVNHLPDAGADDLLDVLHAVLHALKAQHHAAQRQAQDGGLSPMEAKALGYFARHPGATAGDLAARAQRDKGQVARLIQGLRERGLLLAEADAQDRRLVRLHPSAQAQRLHQRMLRERRQLLASATAGLSAAERATLHALLRKLLAGLDG